MHSVCADLPVCVGGHAHQLSIACSTLVRISYFLCLGECNEWVGLHECAQWHACCWIPLCVMNNTAHHVYSIPATRMDLQLVRAQFHLWVHVVPLAIPIPAATHSLVYAALLLSWVVASTHETPSLFPSLPSRDLHLTPSPHSLSLQSCFHHKWICLSLQLFSTSMLSITFLLHFLHLVFYLQLLFMVLLVVMLFIEKIAQFLLGGLLKPEISQL